MIQEAIAAMWFSSMCYLRAVHFLGLSFCHQTVCVAADHCNCFTVVNNTWFRKVRVICGFHSSSLAEVIQSDWCVHEDSLASLELLSCRCVWQPCLQSWTDSWAASSPSGRTWPAMQLWNSFPPLKETEVWSHIWQTASYFTWGWGR